MLFTVLWWLNQNKFVESYTRGWENTQLHYYTIQQVGGLCLNWLEVSYDRV